MDNLELYNISKNQLPRSIKRRYIKVFLLSSSWKGAVRLLFLYQIEWEILIWYVGLLGAINVSFGDFYFLASLQTHHSPKNAIFWSVCFIF